MVLVAAVLFFGALWIPSFVNTLAENQKIGQKVAMEDKTENKNIGFSLSYTEKIRIFSTWPANKFFISGEECFTDTGIR